MADNQNPSLQKNPADGAGLSGAFNFIFQKLLQNTDGMLPCTVIAATDDRMFVTVRPQIMIVGTDQKTTLSRAQVAKVPVFHMGMGGFVLTFPVNPGDPGWLIASDRDISLYIQSGKEAKPNTQRLHSFEDGLFIPDAARLFTLAAGEGANVVLQAIDGSAYVSVGAAQIKLKHPTKVEVDTPLAHFTHDITAEGTITGKVDVKFGPTPISAVGHKHTGVQTGGGTSGGPTN